MRFTVNQLKKRLDKLIADGHGRLPIVVSKTTFQHNCEGDGVTMLDLAGMGVQRVTQSDGDGGTKWNKDGTESSRLCVILVGCLAANHKGDIIDSVSVD